MPPTPPPCAVAPGATGPRWSVVATVREPAALLQAFAAHHLALGALHVHLYLDAPNPDLRAAIGGDPRVRLIDCDADFYDALGRRFPKWINRRQIINANHAETQSAADWLFHLDADEFLAEDPAPELSAAPPDALGFWVPNGERVFLHATPPETIFDGALALPLTNIRRLDRVRGPDMSALTRFGLLAHDMGKGALRVGHAVGAGIHRPRVGPDATHVAQDLRISHFDGMTRLHWALKLQRHAQNGIASKPGRTHVGYRDRQIALAAESGGDLAPIFTLHDRLRVLPPRIARQLTRLGKLVPTGVDAAAAIAQVFPGRAVDLSIAAFDAALGATEAAPVARQA
ncbi:Glycosyl transferase family 2 [Roseivivax lentus]|uniref:Glycosyl transferase family 2 n=1 Tax=Roseivivax lentus TaxID=633194 RepID=A0A1N7MCA1_9RHOB|nr:glycosyltransferase family 2 protein [Roseivivax lentus]SIS83668.1 Glycosyl transferase family 2 [Roseivivax lentus]